MSFKYLSSGSVGGTRAILIGLSLRFTPKIERCPCHSRNSRDVQASYYKGLLYYESLCKVAINVALSMSVIVYYRDIIFLPNARSERTRMHMVQQDTSILDGIKPRQLLVMRRKDSASSADSSSHNGKFLLQSLKETTIRARTRGSGAPVSEAVEQRSGYL